MKIAGTNSFKQELQAILPSSTGQDRKTIAGYIVENKIDLRNCFELFRSDHKTASRFQWLLSDIGLIEPPFLKALLPDLMNYCEEMNETEKTCFANYWLIGGLPEEDESVAMDLCFKWLMDPKINVTIKGRAMNVLFGLMKKYPDIRIELKLCLESLLNKYSEGFERRINHLLLKIET